MYLALKLVHIIAVVAFLGNISIGLFWKAIADRSGSAAIIAHTIKGIIAADRLITVPSILVLLGAGIAAALTAGVPLLHTGWILWSLVLFTIAGLAFMPLSLTQRRMAAVAETGMREPKQKKAYENLSKAWNFWGSIALLAPAIVLVLMVLKPALPTLP
jgi:uncharacterized membrane protein